MKKWYGTKPRDYEIARYQINVQSLGSCYSIYVKIHIVVELLAHNINAKFKISNLLTVIRNLYNSAKSAVRLGRHTGTFFDCGIGVRQGDNLSRPNQRYGWADILVHFLIVA